MRSLYEKDVVSEKKKLYVETVSLSK